jgi:hypothetical protein
MSSIKLDLNKLLGFKILAKEINAQKFISIGAKVGSKPGFKPSPKA